MTAGAATIRRRMPFTPCAGVATPLVCTGTIDLHLQNDIDLHTGSTPDPQWHGAKNRHIRKAHMLLFFVITHANVEFVLSQTSTIFPIYIICTVIAFASPPGVMQM